MAPDTFTPGTAVICRDNCGHVVEGTILDVELGSAAGGGIAFVQAIWPGRKRASSRMVELAFVEVAR